MPVSTRRSSAERRPRAGLTIVEVLVALMLVSIGMLGIAGSTALALRTSLDSAHRRDAAQRVESRLSLLIAAGCSYATSGSLIDPTRDLTEQWTVRSRVNGLAIISDSVYWMSARGPKSFVLASAITC
ncbi:MAG: prepilin-type N-terminal cleavage/methylation domain-containing protein [bacterium]